MGEQSPIPNFLRLEATARLITVQQENNTEIIFALITGKLNYPQIQQTAA